MSMIKATMDYSYLNARIRGKKTQLLNNNDFERLVRATDLDELSRILNSTAYSGRLTQRLQEKPLPGGQEIDKLLTENFLGQYIFLGDFLPTDRKSVV